MGSDEHGGVLAARALAECGVRTLFALPGGHILPLYEGARRVGLDLIGTRHEENAVLMAEGMALATGRVAVAAVTAGPGLANAFPGMVEANASGAPVTVIAGRTGLSQRGRGAVQDLDQLAAVAVATKWREQCVLTDRIPRSVAEAIHHAGSGAPGVSYLEVPQDVLAGAASRPFDPRACAMSPPSRSVAVQGDIDRALDILQNASRPVVLAGSGAFYSGAADALLAFTERTGIPVTTTSAARGLLDDEHPRCLGALVHGGIALASADASLVLGSRFNANLLYGGPPLFPAEQRVVQVDVRPENLGGERQPEVALTGDVRATLDTMTGAWSMDPGVFDEWAAQANAGSAASLASWDAECERPSRAIHPGWLAREVARFAGERDGFTFVSDGGDSVLWGIAMSKARRLGSNLFIGSAMGTLGVGLPFGLGAKAARPDEPVFVFTGDGAFGLSGMELETAARHRIGVVVVVVNNGGWGDVRHEQRTFYGAEADHGAELTSMRYDLMAQASGGHGERVTEPLEVLPALERALKASEEGVPALIDASTDPGVMSDLMKNLSGLHVM